MLQVYHVFVAVLLCVAWCVSAGGDEIWCVQGWICVELSVCLVGPYKESWGPYTAQVFIRTCLEVWIQCPHTHHVCMMPHDPSCMCCCGFEGLDRPR